MCSGGRKSVWTGEDQIRGKRPNAHSWPPSFRCAVCDRLQAGCAKALLGKAVLPDDLPWVTGTIGLLGSKPSSDMMDDCDTLLMIGTGFPWSEFLPKAGKVRAVQIDIDPTMLGIRYTTEVNLHGDAAETLRALLPMLTAKTRGRWREHIEKAMHDWWELMDKRATSPPTRSIPNACAGSCRRAFRPMSSSPAIRARAPTGTPAT